MFNEWKQSVIGQHIDMDGWFGAQCVDLVNNFANAVFPSHKWTETLGTPASAKQLFKSANPEYFEKLTGIIPQPGDIAVYGPTASNSDGHTGVVSRADGNTITLVEQNGFNPAGVAYEELRNYNNLIGFLRPKGGEMADVVTPETLPDLTRLALLREPNADDNVHLGKSYPQAISDFIHSPQRGAVQAKFDNINPTAAEVEEAFKQLQPWSPINPPEYPHQTEYYTSRPKAVLYNDLAIGLRKKLDGAEPPAPIGGYTDADRAQATETNNIVKQIWSKITSIFK